MENINFEDWNKLKIKTGEILQAEDIPESDKLYKLKVDLGTETRTIVAGLKDHYTKEDLSGKKCIVLTNLEPKTICGIESNGMVLATINADESKINLLQADGVTDLGSDVC